MESALTPREIQARVRAGASLEEVARLAGVAPEKVAPFAETVLAERDHVAGIALSSVVRRRGEASSDRILGATITDRLRRDGVDPDSVSWDTWRMENRRWVVQAVWSHVPSEPEASARDENPVATDTAAPGPDSADQSDQIERPGTEADVDAVAASISDQQHQDAAAPTETLAAPGEDTLTIAEFHFDLAARFSVAANPWARWLIDDGPNPDAPEDSDQLALIRALGADDEDGVTPGDAPLELPSVDRSDLPAPGEGTPAPSVLAHNAEITPSGLVTPQEIGEEVEADMDAAFTFGPGDDSNLDVLYDMLGGIAEGSITMRSELEPDQPRRRSTSLRDGVDDTTSFEDEATERLAEELRALRRGPAATAPSADTTAPSADTSPSGSESPVPNSADADSADADSAHGRRRDQGQRQRPGTEQPSLIEDDSPAPRKKRTKRRAQVPSWDEIMFGSPPKPRD